MLVRVTYAFFLATLALLPQAASAIQPLEAHPALLHVAPEDCLFFMHSAGFAKPDPNSHLSESDRCEMTVRFWPHEYHPWHQFIQRTEKTFA